MPIIRKTLPINPFSRPGHKRTNTYGIVFHWVGAAGQTNDQTARYFEILSKQTLHDKSPDRYASAHFIIGMDGEILQVMPADEVAYHVGARDYTAEAKHHFRGYSTNRKMIGYEDEYWTPNWCTIGIEMNHPDNTGKFTKKTLNAAHWLGWKLLRDYALGYDSVFRHFDVTGKHCPKYFVDNVDQWGKFLSRMKSLDLLQE